MNVHVSPSPFKRGLTLWQWAVLGVTAFICLLVSTHGHITHFYGSGFFAFMFMGGLGFALIKFPTGRQPFRYIRFLKQAPPLKPPAELINPLPNDIIHLRLFGEEKIAIACDPLSGHPTINDPGVRAIAVFVSAFAGKFTFISTTGRPDSNVHPLTLGLPHCLIMCDAGPNPADTADRLWRAFQQAGLKSRSIPPSIFEATAGHGLTSSHFIVERLPYSLPLGWLGELAMASSDFTASVTLMPADLQRVRKEAARALEPRLSSHAPSMQELDEYIQALAVRDAAREVLDGRTMPYDVSIDINICSTNNWNKGFANLFFRLVCAKNGVQCKYVRDRVLPFSATFHEQPVPYDMTVTEAAAVACCPFFVDVLDSARTEYRRSQRNKFFDLVLFQSESAKARLKQRFKL